MAISTSIGAWAGDSALWVDLGSAERAGEPGAMLALATAIRRSAVPGIAGVTSAYDSVLVMIDWSHAQASQAPERLRALIERDRESSNRERKEETTREVCIQVCYDAEFGPDLPLLSERTGLAPERVVELHASAEYRSDFLGFMPGFAYLSGLPAPLHAPRLEQPRVRVPAGSVAIAGGQTGVYPFDSPGGWRLIGRTPLRMFDAARPRPSLIEPGDAVRFVPISRARFDELAAENLVRATAAPTTAGVLRVHHPGHFTSVQDLGRLGHAHLGVAPCGAADALALRAGNRIVGNLDADAGLEMTLYGCVLDVASEVVIAITGASAPCVLTTLGGRLVELAGWRAHTIRAGERVRIGALRDGARAYLCVRGGIDTQPVLGSRSTHVPSGLGGLAGRALRAGDALPIGTPTPRAMLANLTASAIETLRSHSCRTNLRIMPGPDADGATLAELCRGVHRVSEHSDRTGVRLSARAELAGRQGNMPSQPVAPGFVQLPPGGGPIVLGPDGPTTGGYGVVATVISADLPVIAMLRPGDEIGFECVSLEQARRARIIQEADLDRACPQPTAGSS